MKLYSYVVRWDHGFAPNPFHGICTLATCKSPIRKKAQEGHWILGTGSAEVGYRGKAIFLMCVNEVVSFNQYWEQERFERKKPVMNGSLEQRFGDNIYHTGADGNWIQADSRHSKEDGSNDFNLRRDTRTTDRVLIGNEFIYWGENAPQIPVKFSKFVIARPGWKEDFSDEEVLAFVTWAKSLEMSGIAGDPIEWQTEENDWRWSKKKRSKDVAEMVGIGAAVRPPCPPARSSP